MRTRGIGHVHLKVTDLDRAVAFYSEFAGLEMTERVGDRFAFLSAGEKHHDLALQQVDSGACVPREDGVGLYHVAFELHDRATLHAAYQALSAAGHPVSPVDHGISEAIYFRDPDGNGVELYVDTRHRRNRWEGVSHPLKLSTEPRRDPSGPA